MHAITYIFQTTSKREMISRFCKASCEKFFAPGKMPEQYQKGIQFLENSTLPSTHISKKHVLEALSAFVRCEGRSYIYDKLFSKIGKIICFYLLANQQAMQIEVESITLTPIPRKVNMRGVLQKVGKAAMIIGGTAIALCITRFGGIPIALAGTRLQVEEAIINDPKLQEIIDTVRHIDFTPLYKKIS